METEYTKIDDSTLGMVKVLPVSIDDLLVQKSNGEEMIAQGQLLVDDANDKISKAISLGIILPE